MFAYKLVILIFTIHFAYGNEKKFVEASGDKTSNNPFLWMLIRQSERTAKKVSRIEDKFDKLDEKQDELQKFTRENAKRLNAISSKLSDFRESPNLAPIVKNISTIETGQLEMRSILNELMNSKTKLGKKLEGMQSEFTSLKKTCNAGQEQLAGLRIKCEKTETNLVKLQNKMAASQKETIQKMNDLKTKLSSCLKKGDMTCEAGWRLYGIHCYYFSQNKISWNAAKDDCRQKGGHLVKVEGKAENDWLLSVWKELKLYYPWIGANDIQKKRSWKWESDQTPLNYSLWAPKEPNNSNGVEYCAQLWIAETGGWNDNLCTNPYSYICEKP